MVSPSAQTVLVIDDEEHLRSALEATLTEANYRVVLAPEGTAGLRAFFEARPDLVVLDIRMPNMDGRTILDRIREVADTPVIMLTALGDEKDKVLALKGGADDYVEKPFRPAELVARCEAVLRRSRRSAQPEDRYVDGVVQIDYLRQEVVVQGQTVDLSPLEYRLLSALVRNANITVGPDALMNTVWGEGYGSLDSLRVSIGNLRKKLQVDAGTPKLIETVREFGYRYRQPAD